MPRSSSPPSSSSPPPSPPPSTTEPEIRDERQLAERFNDLQDLSHCTASAIAARLFRIVGLGRSFDKMRNHHRLHRATKLNKPSFKDLEADNLRRVARLARQGTIEVPVDFDYGWLPGVKAPPTYEVVQRVERNGKEWADRRGGVRARLVALGWDEEFMTGKRVWEGIG